MAKAKYVKITKSEFEKYVNSSKIMSNSLENINNIKKQFNNLNIKQRLDIKKIFKATQDNINEKFKSIDESLKEDVYITCTMVDLNIIAAEYNIDPATVLLCFKPPCKNGEKIIVK